MAVGTTTDAPSPLHAVNAAEPAQVARNGPADDFGALPRPPKRPRPKKLKKPAAPKEPPMAEKELLLEYFPSLYLGEKVYKWQFDCLKALGRRGSRVALRAANGSGKTSKVVAAAILWHLIRFPGAPVVVTAGVYRQLTDVLLPVLKTKIVGLGGAEMGFEATENKVRYTAPGSAEPSMMVAFSASDPEKAEGWHARGPDENLLFIIDEAKGVSDLVFQAMERCQPTRVLVVSSPGGRAGSFHQIFRKPDTRYKTFVVTAYDCPHITKEWIKEQIDRYGEKSALIQSMIFAEFGEDEGVTLVLPPSVLQKAISSPPAKMGSQKRAGVDFAAGGDENVIAFAEGNAVKEMVRWREKDTMSAIGRFITEFKRLGLEADQIWADAGGMGIPMCDALREAGYDVHRVNNGEAGHNPDKFANRGTEMWTEYARMVETGKVIIPDDELLHAQLTTRWLGHNAKGKLLVEPKDKMKQRGLSSPDRADAVVLAFTGAGASMDSYMARYGRGISINDLDDDEFDAEGGRKPMAGAWAG